MPSTPVIGLLVGDIFQSRYKIRDVREMMMLMMMPDTSHWLHVMCETHPHLMSTTAIHLSIILGGNITLLSMLQIRTLV